jgi:hypothetical protein
MEIHSLIQEMFLNYFPLPAPLSSSAASASTNKTEEEKELEEEHASCIFAQADGIIKKSLQKHLLKTLYTLFLHHTAGTFSLESDRAIDATNMVTRSAIFCCYDAILRLLPCDGEKPLPMTLVPLSLWLAFFSFCVFLSSCSPLHSFFQALNCMGLDATTRPTLKKAPKTEEQLKKEREEKEKKEAEEAEKEKEKAKKKEKEEKENKEKKDVPTKEEKKDEQKTEKKTESWAAASRSVFFYPPLSFCRSPHLSSLGLCFYVVGLCRPASPPPFLSLH